MQTLALNGFEFNSVLISFCWVLFCDLQRSTWPKVWCVVRRHLGAGLGAVQFAQYKTQMDAAQDLGCCARIDLSTATAICSTPKSKKKHSFMVECTRAARLGAGHMSVRSTNFSFHGSSAEESEEWIKCLLEHAPSARFGASATLRKNLTGSLPDLSKADDVSALHNSLSSLDVNQLYEPSGQ